MARSSTCLCGECPKCKRRVYMRNWYRENRQVVQHPRACLHCGKVYQPYNDQQMYCSGGCKTSAGYWRKHSRDGRVCQGCGNDIGQMRGDAKWCSDACARAGRPQRLEINRRSRFKTQYGMSLEDYEAMLEQQGGGCAICGTTEIRGFGARLAVDHCHDSNSVRGILCGNCNRGIGHFNHDPALLTAAAEYLKGA